MASEKSELALTEKLRLLAQKDTGITIDTTDGHLALSLRLEKRRVYLVAINRREISVAATELSVAEIEQVIEVLKAYKQILSGEA